MATVTIPDSYLDKFKQFDEMEALLKAKWQSRGVSRANISGGFAVLTTARTCWRDPAFMVWAGMNEITEYGDFFERWGESEETDDNDAATFTGFDHARQLTPGSVATPTGSDEGPRPNR